MGPARPEDWRGIEPWFWPAIARELPRRKKKPFLKKRRKGGRPRCDDRLALSAIFWRLRCDAPWGAVPARFGSAATARRRLSVWLTGGIVDRAWRAYLAQLSIAELRRWYAILPVADHGQQPYWRANLLLVWRRGFAPLLAEPPL